MKLLNFFNGPMLLKIALGFSIIAIGYLTTMFFFQVQDLNVSFNNIEAINKNQFDLQHLNTNLKIEGAKLTVLVHNGKLDSIKRDSLLESIVNKELLLISDNNFHNKNLHYDLENLLKLINERRSILNSIVNEAQSDSASEILINSLIKDFEVHGTKIDNLFYRIISEENNSVLKYNTTFEKKLVLTRNTVLLIALVSVMIFLLSYNKMDDVIYNLKKTNDELKIVNEIFKTSEEIASFGYWKYNLVHKKFTYSRNLYKIFQVSPDSFEEHEYSILKFLHPDDVESIESIHKESLVNKQPVSLFYRILMPDNTIKYMSAMSSFTKNGKEEDVKIVVIQDISELYKSNIELKEINDQLLATNSELESFNNIVSHDLQEPLRKIQMFVSRLDETEISTLSIRGRDIFDKIKLASNRMQKLMIDMVNYSRTIKEDKILVDIDLNHIMTDVIKNNTIVIEESNAQINYDNLPTIIGVKFQINQLFDNVIGNALKYRKQDVAPIITIKHQIIFHDEVFELADLHNSPKRTVSNKNYYKISIQDNGIGFSSEYAQNVFQLFKRLDHSKKYDGTGLGLAICKKIIENHRGYIKAESIIGQGSEFSFYFPKFIKEKKDA